MELKEMKIEVRVWNEEKEVYELAWESPKTYFPALDRGIIRQYGFEISDINVYPVSGIIVVYARKGGL